MLSPAKMKKAITIAFLFCFLYSGAQDEQPARLNMMAGYSAGFQFLKLNMLEEVTLNYLKPNISSGFYNKGKAGPTFFNHIFISASVFRNKTLFLEFDGSWGYNEVTSYGYTADALGNPIEYKSNVNIRFLYTGYGIRKEINLGKWGVLMPGLNFYLQYHNHSVVKVNYRVIDKANGEIIKTGAKNGGSTGYGFHGSRAFFLFENPRLSIDYHVKIANHVYFNFSYSYWMLDGILNDLYGLSNTWIVKFRNSHRIPAGRNREFAYDLYSHNISVGLCFKLNK